MPKKSTAAKPKSTETFARLMPYNPRLGFHVQRWMYNSRLFQGGVVPRWYKVTKAQADYLSAQVQDPNAPEHMRKPLFQIADGDQKHDIDIREEQLRLAALGLIAVNAAPVTVGQKGSAIDITADTGKPPDEAARSSMIPQVREGTIVSGAAGRGPIVSGAEGTSAEAPQSAPIGGASEPASGA